MDKQGTHTGEVIKVIRLEKGGQIIYPGSNKRQFQSTNFTMGLYYCNSNIYGKRETKTQKHLALGGGCRRYSMTYILREVESLCDFLLPQI